jgi:hypothetical protein
MKSSKEPLFYIETMEPTCNSLLSGLWSNLDGSTTIVSVSGDADSRKKMTASEQDDIYPTVWSVMLGVQKTRTSDGDFPFSEELMRRTPFNVLLQMNEVEHKRMLMFIRALASHPQVECEYKELIPSYASPKAGVKYKIVIPEYEKNRRADDIVNRANALVMFCSMDLEMQRKVAFYYSFNAEGYDKDGLLVDFFEPKIHISPEACAKFLKTFTDVEVLNEGIADLIVIKKAMLLSQEDGEPFEFRNNQYFLGEKYIGSDAESILGYFKERPSDFTALCSGMRGMVTDEERQQFLSNRGVTRSDSVAAVASKVSVSSDVEESKPASASKGKGGGKSKGATVSTEKSDDDDDMPY